MFDSLAGIHRLLTRAGVQAIIVIIPSKFAYRHPRYQAAAVESIRRAERAATERGLPFVSLYEALGARGGEGLFMDFCHPTAEGNQVIASELLPIVGAWGDMLADPQEPADRSAAAGFEGPALPAPPAAGPGAPPAAGATPSSLPFSPAS